MGIRHKCFDESAKDSAEKFMKIFQSMVKGIKSENDTCDRFTAMTGGSVATIFEKRGDDFLRIATSLKKEDGTRAVGTTLDRNHPAYPLLFKGETYVGKATLSGKDYMTKYVPVKDGSGNVIGVYFIGFDITKTMKHLKDYIRSIKVGKATATEEQSSASDEVARSAEHSSMLSQDVKNTTEEVSKEVENLNNVIAKLTEAIKGVKV